MSKQKRFIPFIFTRTPESGKTLPVSFLCPAVLRKRVKVIAAQNGKTVKELWIVAMENFLNTEGT